MNALEKIAAKKKLAGRLGAGIGAVLGGTAGQIAGSATGNLGGILLSRAAGSGLGAALGASKGRRLRSGLAASLLAHTGNLPPALAAALVHGKKRSRITDRISSGLGEARDAFGRDRGAVGRLKKKISDLLSRGRGTLTTRDSYTPTPISHFCFGGGGCTDIGQRYLQ